MNRFVVVKTDHRVVVVVLHVRDGRVGRSRLFRNRQIGHGKTSLSSQGHFPASETRVAVLVTHRRRRVQVVQGVLLKRRSLLGRVQG